MIESDGGVALNLPVPVKPPKKRHKNRNVSLG